MTEETPIVRFAPSPTGWLHLGHACSALLNARFAKEQGGRFLLRIEDIDEGRCRAEYVDGIREDLAWLGIEWEEPVRLQSDHFADYQAMLDRLEEMGLLYPCFCTRKDIQAEIKRSGHAPHGPEGPLYPGLCRNIPDAERLARKSAAIPFAIRLDMDRSIACLKTRGLWPLIWQEGNSSAATADPTLLGDVVLARKDTPTSYHLAVTHDDHLQGVTHIIRGEDLRHTTHIHRLLQALHGYDTPHYTHHALLTGPDGNRLAKRDKSQTIRALREAGRSPEDLMRMAGLEKP